MSAQGPYRGAPAAEPAPVVSRPVPWKRYGLSVMACSGIAFVCVLSCAWAMNEGRAESYGIEVMRWALVACFVVFATGASVAVCAEIRGDR